MFDSLSKYGGFNSYDLLKSIAIVTMVVDHIGFFFYPDVQILRVIGRAAYPLFAFCIGYNKKYHADATLLILAIAMVFIDLILSYKGQSLGNPFQDSVLFSIITVKTFMKYMTKIINEKTMFNWLVILISLAPITYEMFPYGTLGIIMAICGYLCASNEEDSKGYQIFLAISLIFYAGIEVLGDSFNWSSSCFLAIIFIALYRLLSHFSIWQMKLPSVLNKILLFSSRYSLMIYFIHYEIFYLVSYMISKN